MAERSSIFSWLILPKKLVCIVLNSLTHLADQALHQTTYFLAMLLSVNRFIHPQSLFSEDTLV